jgi:hypothetical protein
MNDNLREEGAEDNRGDADRMADASDDEDDNAMNPGQGNGNVGDEDEDDGEGLVNLNRVGSGNCPSPEEEFDSLCAKLKGNDPKQTWVFSPKHVAGYGMRLGNALVGNTHVAELSLSLRPEDVNSPDDDNWGVESIALILQYLRQGTAFRELTVLQGTLEYIRPCIAAIAQNPETTKLILHGYGEMPIVEIADLLRTSQTLNAIAMPMVNSLELAEAFQVNQTLNVVTLMFDPDALPKPNGAILYHLVSKRPPCVLTIGEESDSHSRDMFLVDTAITSLVSRAVWLLELRLSAMSFSQSRMQLLMDGLLCNRSIEDLEFTFCTFDNEAVSLLHLLVMSPSNREALAESKIREHSVMDEDITNDFVALFVLGFPCLQLNWKWRDPDTTLGAFWNLLQAHSSMVQLQVLWLQHWPDSDEERDLCIPLLPTLRELYFDLDPYIFDEETALSFLQAVRKSSGLLHVSIARSFPVFWSEAEARIVRASFQRNQNVPGLVSMPRVGCLEQDESDYVEINLYPSLFHAAKQSL